MNYRAREAEGRPAVDRLGEQALEVGRVVTAGEFQPGFVHEPIAEPYFFLASAVPTAAVKVSTSGDSSQMLRSDQEFS